VGGVAEDGWLQGPSSSRKRVKKGEARLLKKRQDEPRGKRSRDPRRKKPPATLNGEEGRSGICFSGRKANQSNGSEGGQYCGKNRGFGGRKEIHGRGSRKKEVWRYRRRADAVSRRKKRKLEDCHLRKEKQSERSNAQAKAKQKGLGTQHT